MAIKDVTGLTPPPAVDPSKGKGETAPRPTRPQSSPTVAGADQVTLTSVGQFLAQAAADPAPVDQPRVDALRQAIADGTFEVDSQRIATRLLLIDRELG